MLIVDGVNQTSNNCIVLKGTFLHSIIIRQIYEWLFSQLHHQLSYKSPWWHKKSSDF